MSSSLAGLKSRLRQVSFLRRLKRSVIGPRTPARRPGLEVIREYVDGLEAGADLKVVFGGHWSDNPGWLLLSEADQDITTRLQFADRTVDVVLTEHVIEHVPFVGGVHYFQECARILKSGGICRTVCPMLDRMMDVDLRSANGITYVENSLKPFYSDANQILTELELGGLQENVLPFFFGALYMGHEHRFIWTSDLMIKVMKAVGFREARRVNIGEGSQPEVCIERRRRGVYLGHDWREELLVAREPFDVESFVVEGIR